MIKEQLDLMKQAIHTYSEIETILKIIEPVDAITSKVLVADLQNQYIDIMQKLLSNLLTTSNVI